MFPRVQGRFEALVVAFVAARGRGDAEGVEPVLEALQVEGAEWLRGGVAVLEGAHDVD